MFWSNGNDNKFLGMGPKEVKFRQKLMLLTCSLCKDYFSLYPLVSRSIVVTGKNIQLWNIHLCFHPWTTVRDNHNLCRSWVVLLLKLVAMLSKGRLSQISQCCFMQRLSGTTLFTSLYWPWLFLKMYNNMYKKLFNFISFSLSHQEERTSRFLSFLTRPTNYSGLMSHYHQDHHSHHQDLLPRDPKFLTSLTSLMDSLLPSFTRRLPKPQMFVDLRRATLKLM